MKTLILMRHAKSSWDEPNLPDRERPLTKRGEKDALRIGKTLKSEEIFPDLILCSTAVRAAKTAEAVAEKLDYKKEIIYMDGLYLAEPTSIIEILREKAGDIKKVMVVGHNPGMEGLVQILTHKVESLPTAAVAVIKLPVEKWSELETVTEGRLAEYWRPRDLK